MKTKTISVIVLVYLACIGLAVVLDAQTPLTLADLKTMIADRDITIELQGRRIRDLESENARLKSELAKVKPEDCSIIADTVCQH